MRHRSPIALVGIAALGGTMLAAAPAGAATSKANSLVAKAIAASEAAQSVRVSGKVSQGKETISLNVQASNDAKGQGSIGINGAVANVIRLGARIYFSANKSFWTENGGAAAASLFDGKWVFTKATSSDGQSLAEFMDLTSLLHEVFGGNLSSAKFTVGKNTTVNGVAVSTINGRSSKGASEGTLYVARSGKPYVIELKGSGASSGNGSLIFSAYNQSVNPVAPKNAINLDQLSQAG
jgi:hypothetical protein